MDAKERIKPQIYELMLKHICNMQARNYTDAHAADNITKLPETDKKSIEEERDHLDKLKQLVDY